MKLPVLNDNYGISTVLQQARSKCTHTLTHSHRHPHMSILYRIKRGLHDRGKTAVWKGKHDGSILLKKICFKVPLERVPRGFLLEKKGQVIPCRGAGDRRGTRTNRGKSDMRNLEAESIRSRAENIGGCVKLKTVTSAWWQPVLNSTCSNPFWWLWSTWL